MKRIAIIGAGEFQVPLVKRCKERGIETHVFAWDEGAQAKEFAAKFYPISILNINEILEVCEKLKIDGICSIASELAMLTVSSIASKMHLVGNSIESANLTLNKKKMKDVFIQNNIPCALGREFSNYEEARVYSSRMLNSRELIIKPSDRSGSLAINHLKNLDHFENAFNFAYNSSFSKTVVIEEFIGGDEYSAETVSINGVHSLISFTQKVTTGSPYFVETGHFQPVVFSNSITINISKIINNALDVLKITQGISHCEFKILNNEIKIIEIGGRMGGDFIGSHLTPLSSGISMVDIAIDISLRQFSEASLVRKFNKSIGVMFLTSTIDGVLKESESNVLETIKILESKIDKKIGENIEKATSSCKRFGHIIFEGSPPKLSQVFEHFGVIVN